MKGLYLSTEFSCATSYSPENGLYFNCVKELNEKIPDSVKKEAMAIRDGIAAGTLHSFTGPINKQDGSPWLKAGETADVGTLLGMNFYVEGIEGEITK